MFGGAARALVGALAGGVLAPLPLLELPGAAATLRVLGCGNGNRPGRWTDRRRGRRGERHGERHGRGRDCGDGRGGRGCGSGRHRRCHRRCRGGCRGRGGGRRGRHQRRCRNDGGPHDTHRRHRRVEDAHHVVERVAHVTRALIPHVRVDGARSRDHPLERGRGRARVHRRVAHTGQQLGQYDAERVHVGARVGRDPRGLLGCDVTGRPHERARHRERLAVGRLRDPEVGDLDRARRGHEHVARLHVAVHHALGVRRRQRLGDLGAELGDLARRDPALLHEHLAQAPAVDELHHHEGGAGVLAPVVDRDDVRVVQPGCGAGLVLEALAGDVGRDRRHLHRDRAIEQEVTAGEHLTHAADAPRAIQAIPAAEDCSHRQHGSLAASRDTRPAAARSVSMGASPLPTPRNRTYPAGVPVCPRAPRGRRNPN